MELIYTRRTSGFEQDKHYRNPRFFSRPERGATSVVLDGEFPEVRRAYEAVGVHVSGPQPKAATQPEAETPIGEEEEAPKPRRRRKQE